MYDDTDVHCDTLHSLFKYISVDTTIPVINRALSKYDIIIIDEISQVSVDMFHHITGTIDKVIPRPILFLSGDFAQQQPLITLGTRTTTTKNIFSCQHCTSCMIKFHLSCQHRIHDDLFSHFLQAIRYDYPSDEVLTLVTSDRVFCLDSSIDANIYDTLTKKHPDSVILTMTKKFLLG